VHVPLGRRQVLMAREFLNRPCGSPAHRQMRTERVGDNNIYFYSRPQPVNVAPQPEPALPPEIAFERDRANAIAAYHTRNRLKPFG